MTEVTMITKTQTPLKSALPLFFIHSKVSLRCVDLNFLWQQIQEMHKHLWCQHKHTYGLCQKFVWKTSQALSGLAKDAY